MARYIGNRFLGAVIVLLLVSVVSFGLIHAAPGGVGALMDPSIAPEDRARIAALMGLDQPAHVQYGRWLARMLQGDMGVSFTYSRPVASLIGERLPATLLLAGLTLLVSVVTSLLLGSFTAIKHGTGWDRLVTTISILGLSVPAFWFGILLIILFSVTWKLLPSSGMMTIGVDFDLEDLARHLVMPVFVLSLPITAELTRYMRSSVLDVLASEFITVARAKGLAERVILFRHIVRNALIPPMTMLGFMLPRLVGGAAVVESVFAWPGMGRLGVEAAYRRDYPLVMGVTILISVAVIVSNLLVDLAYPLVDPRIRRR